MTQQHGRTYEHTLSRELDAATTSDVWVTTAGYSGNAAVDACDVVVTVDPKVRLASETPQYNVEAKKRQGEGGKRVSGVFGGSGDETGLAELWRLVDATPRWADPIVVVAFDHRKPVVLDARWLLYELDDRDHYAGTVNAAPLDALDPRLTPSNNVSMIKPTLDEWPSARASPDDGYVVADALGLPIETEAAAEVTA